jgi:hypothetical protein
MSLQSLPFELHPRLTQGAEIIEMGAGTWRLIVPEGVDGNYRLAQLDDYANHVREDFRWQVPFQLSLCVRASDRMIPGTWGFGFWNDPFSMALRGGGGKLRLPALPNAAWVFHASPPNHLSLDDDLPARGWYVSTYRADQPPAYMYVLGVFALPLLFFPPGARLVRRYGRRFVQQDGAQIHAEPTGWHHFEIDCGTDVVVFSMDRESVFETGVVPKNPLGLVIWIDNQFAAFPPSGRLRFGTLPNSEPAWIEIKDLYVIQDP